MSRFTKVVNTIKQAVEYFSTGVGAVYFLAIVIGAFVVVPPVISLPVAGVVGLTLGCYKAYRAYKEYNDREAKVLLAAARRHADAQDSSETKIGISELEYLLTQSNSAFAQVFMSGGRSVLEAQVAAEKAKAEDRRQEGKESESVITSDMATHFQPLFQVGHRPSFQTITAANQAVFEGTDEHKLSL